MNLGDRPASSVYKFNNFLGIDNYY